MTYDKPYLKQCEPPNDGDDNPFEGMGAAVWLMFSGLIAITIIYLLIKIFSTDWKT